MSEHRIPIPEDHNDFPSENEHQYHYHKSACKYVTE